MARAVWPGTISFGLVNVPVKAYTAVRDHEVHFLDLTALGRQEDWEEPKGRSDAVRGNVPDFSS